MNKLKSIGIQGWKSIRDAHVELGDVNVLVGANGAGKSNFLEAIALVGPGVRDHMERKAKGKLHQGQESARSIRLEAVTEKATYRLELAPSDNGRLVAGEEVLETRSERINLQPAQRLGQPGAYAQMRGKGQAGETVREMRGWRIHTFDCGPDSKVRGVQNVHNRRTLVGNGANLASFLQTMRERNRSSYQSVLGTVQLSAPFIADLDTAPTGDGVQKCEVGWVQEGTGERMRAEALSPATLKLIWLTALLMGPEEGIPSVILMEEPDAGLNPFAKVILAGLIGSAALTSQVIFTTQDPGFLDHFKTENVIVVDRADGETKFSRLDPQEQAPWLERYSLGELWEKNKFGGRPTGRIGEIRTPEAV